MPLMPRIAAPLDASAGDPTTDAPSAWLAEVVSVTSQTAMVRIPGYDPAFAFGPCRYLDPAGTIAPGDSVVAVLVGDDSPWVFKPGQGSVGSAGGLPYATAMKWGSD